MKHKIRDIRKEEIVKGFYELSKENGLENTSIAKIGKHLKMPPSLIMHYFPNKDLLIQELIKYILDQYQLIYEPIIQQIDQGQSLNAELLVEKLFSREWNALFDDGVFYSCYALIFRNREIRKEYKHLHEGLRSTLESILRKDPELKKTDTGALSEKIFVVVEGAYYYLSMFDNEEEYQQKLKYFKEQVYDLLRKEALAT
ncbi:TetR family transcriptional regulator [Belliella marina]|uniref:Biofilm operon icaADBC HTH-type negative transcriptional regulator IcaR n=1 Tax=Belliella marina TaxID=1644146 RepID=A0ABW4VS89_9BACT